MPRNIVVLYDSRAEAEEARARLVAGVGAKSPRLISRETAGAIDGLGLNRPDADRYADSVRGGAHLLVAEVQTGVSPKRIIAALQEPESASDQAGPGGQRSHQGVQVKLPDHPVVNGKSEPVSLPQQDAKRPQENWPPQAPEERMRPGPVAADPTGAVVEEKRLPVVEDGLRVGKRQVLRDGARVRSFTQEGEAAEQVTIEQEVVDVDFRASERDLSQEDVEEAGLFKGRVFEVAEMREEPVVTKIAVVREEIIIRKTVSQRQETVRGTVRHTEVAIEDLAEAVEDAPDVQQVAS